MDCSRTINSKLGLGLKVKENENNFYYLKHILNIMIYFEYRI